MSVTECDRVDGIALDGKRLILMISDHLTWDREYEHLLALQAKINAYISFCESKQYENVYPNAQVCSAVIQICFLYEPTQNATDFLLQVQLQLCHEGISIECHLTEE